VLALEVGHQGCFGTVSPPASLDLTFVTFDAEAEMFGFLLQIQLLVQALPDRGLQILGKTRLEFGTLLPQLLDLSGQSLLSGPHLFNIRLQRMK